LAIENLQFKHQRLEPQVFYHLWEWQKYLVGSLGNSLFFCLSALCVWIYGNFSNPFNFASIYLLSSRGLLFIFVPCELSWLLFYKEFYLLFPKHYSSLTVWRLQSSSWLSCLYCRMNLMEPTTCLLPVLGTFLILLGYAWCLKFLHL
jgi:hypothetical protein